MEPREAVIGDVIPNGFERFVSDGGPEAGGETIGSIEMARFEMELDYTILYPLVENIVVYFVNSNTGRLN